MCPITDSSSAHFPWVRRRVADHLKGESSRLCLALAALSITGVGFAVAANHATAASTRAEYVAQADPICQAGQTQERAAFEAYRKAIRRYLNRLPHPDPFTPGKKVIRLVVHHYERILAIDRSVNSQLSSISSAPGDEAAVAEWLQLRARSADLLDRAVHAVRRHKPRLFIRLYLKSIRRTLQAELPIRDFGFQHCSSTPPDVIAGS